MNKDFKKYDKNCQRKVYIKIDDFNKILSSTGIMFSYRNMALHNKYQAYLETCMKCYTVPVGFDIYEKKYFSEKFSVIAPDNKPVEASICKALGIRSIAFEWAKDSYGRLLNDELEVRYRV